VINVGLSMYSAPTCQPRSAASVRAFASEFGLTPSAEQRFIAASVEESGDNPFG
jgi:phage terminase small subunit